MRLNLRVDQSNNQHTRVTVFTDGANCGQLCLATRDVGMLFDILGAGINRHDNYEFQTTGRKIATADQP